MSNPFQSLKYLPWAALFQSAGVTVVVTALVEYLLFQLLAFLSTLSLSGAIATPLTLFLGILPFLLAIGVGALALMITARLFQQIILRQDTMWALVACVLVFLPLKNFLVGRFIDPSIPMVGLSVVTIVFVAVGVFTAGRRYWRY